MVSAFVECFLVWKTAWSKDALSEDRDERRLLMPAGMFFVARNNVLIYCEIITNSSRYKSFS